MAKKKNRRFQKVKYWVIHNTAVPMLSLFLHLLRLTMRIEFDTQKDRDLKEKYGNLIYAFWHENLILICIASWYVREATYVMVSPSNDGEIIARVGAWFRLLFVRGSTFKNPREALKKIIGLLKKGSNAAMAIDGPRGPRHNIQKGVFLMSRLGTSPIIPIRIECSNYWTINSWDRTRIPKPFSKMKVIYGEPIESFLKVRDPDQEFTQLESFLNDELDQKS